MRVAASATVNIVPVDGAAAAASAATASSITSTPPAAAAFAAVDADGSTYAATARDPLATDHESDATNFEGSGSAGSTPA